MAAKTRCELSLSTTSPPMCWRAKVADPMFVQVVPPSVVLRMPHPACESLWLSSPVPA